MNISIPTLETSYRVLQDVWIETNSHGTKPVEKYLQTQGRILPMKGKTTSFMGKAYGNRLYEVTPIRKVLLKAGDIIQIFNLYPAKKKTAVGFEFKLLYSDSPIIAAGCLTLWNAALNPLLSIEAAPQTPDRAEGMWVNHVSSRILSVRNLVTGLSGSRNGLWASYVDAQDSSQNFNVMMNTYPARANIDISPSYLVEIVSPNGERKNKAFSRPGVIFPLIRRDRMGYTPYYKKNSWASTLGNHYGVDIPYDTDQKINFDLFMKQHGSRSKVFGKHLKSLFDTYGCIPDGYYPFLFIEGHKFQFSYISAEVLILGGFIDKTSTDIQPTEKAACFPFENGKLSFHTNIIKFKIEKK